MGRPKHPPCHRRIHLGKTGYFAQGTMGFGGEAGKDFGEYAGTLDRSIVLELEPFKLSLIRDVDSMLQFLEEVNHPCVRANLDISHLCLSKVAPAEMQKLLGRVGHVHISDCDGIVHGDLPPGKGVVDFKGYLGELKKLNVDGVISIELEYSPEPEKSSNG